MNGSIAEETPPLQPSRLTAQLHESQEAQDLAFFVYRADQRLGRADVGADFTMVDPCRPAITSADRDELRARAAVAIRLGDPVKRAAMTERAALAILRNITRRVTRGQLAAGDPEVQLDLSGARALAQVAIEAALNYLAGKEAM